jgi:hypothetical protein
MTCYYRYQNRKRDREEGGAPPKGMHIDGIATEFDKAKGESYSELLYERERSSDAELSCPCRLPLHCLRQRMRERPSPLAALPSAG